MYDVRIYVCIDISTIVTFNIKSLLGTENVRQKPVLSHRHKEIIVRRRKIQPFAGVSTNYYGETSVVFPCVGMQIDVEAFY
jgi:hypothetical protein